MIYKYVEEFYKKFNGPKCIIGKSFYGNNIYAVHVGDIGGRQYISTYAIHGREWITAKLAIKHAKLGTSFGGWIVPLLNPDGAFIAQCCNKDWKANGLGVDLNCNFDAGWGKGVNNTFIAGSSNYVGSHPFCQRESSAIAAFTKRVNPCVTFSFHTKGGEIYWEYQGGGDKVGARIIAKASGYKIKEISGSHGGYKDWCIQKLGIPSYTIECGKDALTHPITKLKDIKECFNILKYFTREYEK